MSFGSNTALKNYKLPEEEMRELLPYLYQDFEEIQTNTEAMIELAQLYWLDLEGKNVIDLCCSKGTSLLKLAKKFQCKGVGVDISSHFVADAKLRSLQNRLTSLVTFEHDDIRNYIKTNHTQYDLVIYPYHESIFGDMDTSLNHLQKLLKPKGHLLLSAQYRLKSLHSDISVVEEENIKSVETSIMESAFKNIGRVKDKQFDYTDRLKKEHHMLNKRSQELIAQKPYLRAHLDSFLQEHKRKIHQFQDNLLSHATWLLQLR